MGLRRLVVCVTGSALLIFGLPAVPAQAAPTVSTPITYVYDEIGRLEAVVDPTAATNGIAKYAYDDVGNLLSITRQSATTTRILDLHGKTGQVGSTVTIYGSSYNTTPSQNQVRFIKSTGVSLTVTAATATTLTATVPAGAPGTCTTAPGCSIWVKNNGTAGTATSTQKYLVTGSLVPTISGFTPTSGDAGTTVTITGTNFDTTSAASNNVFFNGTRAQVTAVTSTTLTVKSPPFVGPGKVGVQTANGEATSTADFVAPTSGFVSSDVQSATRVTLGQTSTLTVSTANKVAFGLFDGQQGHDLFIDVPGATTAQYPTVGVFDPFGRLLVATALPPTGGIVPTQVLPYDGTYTIAFNPQGTDTGQMTITPVDATHTTTSVTPGGASIPFSTSVMGQNARFTFDGMDGQRVSALVSSTTYPCCPWLRLIEPTGRDVGGAVQSAGPGFNAFLDVQTLTWGGTHYFEFDPSNKDVGSGTIQVYDVPPDPNYPISIGGPVVTGSNTVPGQNYTLTFPGSSGQTVNLVLSGFQMFGVTHTVKILRPDGSQLFLGFDAPAGTTTFSSIALDQTGTFTIVYDLSKNTVASRNFQLTLASGLRRSTPRPFDAASHGGQASESGSLDPAIVAAAKRATQASSEGVWSPVGGEFESHLPASPFEDLPIRNAPSGRTALVGRALTIDGAPLPGVTLSIGDATARTDAIGHFLLTHIRRGKQVLEIDGSTANTGGATYGFYEARVHIRAHRTNPLGWTIWMTKLDLSTTVHVSPRLNHDVVLKTPDIPGFSVHIPKGSHLTGEDGDPVTELSLTAIPVDRPPFPLPPFGFPMYFTVQPGGTYVSGQGAWVVYPNIDDLPPGVRVPFSHYDPDGPGWYVYGHGRVTHDGRRIVPDRHTRIWSFTGGGHLFAGVGPAVSRSCKGQQQPMPGSKNCDGDPVDLSSGLFAHGETDLVEGGLPAFGLTREYRQNDSNTYSFGLGTGTPYDMYLYSTDNGVSLDLGIPGDRTIHFTKILGTPPNNAVHEAQSTPGPFYKARTYFTPDEGTNIHGWNVYLRDGTHLIFGLGVR